MLNLMKYEWLKQKSSKLVLGGFLLVAEAIFLLGVFLQRGEGVSVGITLLALLSMIGLVVVALESILIYYQDMKEKRGYMLFMTPHSMYSILAGKLLVGFLMVVFWTVLVFILAFADVSLLVAQVAGMKELLNMFRAISEDLLAMDISWSNAAFSAIYMIAEWATMVTAAFFAITISMTLLTTAKWKGLISFLIYLAIGLVNSRVNRLVLHLSGFNGGSSLLNLFFLGEDTASTSAFLDISAITMIALSVNLVVCILCFLGSGTLLKKRLSC